MSEVTIKWVQRVAGYEIGDEVTVERTAFIDAVIAAGRVEVISESTPVVIAEPEPEPKPGPRRRGNFEVVDDGGTETE